MSKSYFLAAMMLGLPLAALGDIRCNKVYAEYSALEELCSYQEGLAAFKIRHQWGFVDAAGKVVVEPIYDEVSDFASGLAAVSVDKKWGFIDKSGALRIPMQYEWVDPFSEGLSAVHLDDTYGYIDPDNRLVIPAIYKRAGPFKHGVAVVENEAGLQLMIDKAGKVIKSFGSDVSLDMWRAYFGHYVATVKYPRFLVNADGRRVALPPEAGSDPTYGDGVLVVSRVVNRESLDGVMAMDGKWLVEPRFANIHAYSDGLAVATIESKSEMRERTHGLIDKRGEFVVPPIYPRLERKKSGVYLGYHQAPDSRTDVFDAAGKPLFSAKSDLYENLSQGGWTVFSSGGEGGDGSWVISPRGTAQHIAIASPEVSQVGEYLLLSKKNEGKEGESEDEGETFFLMGPQGIVLSSKDPGVKGKFDWAWMISAKGEQAQARPELLPLAMLVKGYRQMAIFTRDHKLITQDDWEYESALLDYRYNSSDQALEGPFVIKAGEAWGAIDGKGQWVVQPGFSRLTPFRNGLAFAVREGEEVMVDNAGRVIAFPPGRGYRRIAPFLIAGVDEAGVAAIYRIRDGQSDKLALPPGVSLGERFEQGLITARVDEKWGLLDIRDGRWALAPVYPGEPEPLRQEGGKLIGWKTAIQVEHEKNTVTRHGLVSPQGQELVKPLFAGIDVDYEHGPLLRTGKDGHSGGMLDASGKEILANIHESIRYTDHGWYLARRGEQRGVVNTRGEWTVQPGPYWFNQLDTRPYGREETGDDKLWHVHVDGTTSTRDKPQPMADDRPAYWWSAVEGPYGEEQTVFYGFDWKARLRLPGESRDGFANDWVVLKTGEKKRGFPTALANSAGKIVGPLPYDQINPFSDGLFLVRQGAEEARQGRRYGFIDTQGKVAIPLKFEAADDFSEDRAIVLSRGNLGAIDKSGKLILHSAWRCGEHPVLLDGKEKIIWPKDEKAVCQ